MTWNLNCDKPEALYMPKMVPVGMPASMFLLPSNGSKTASYDACLSHTQNSSWQA